MIRSLPLCLLVLVALAGQADAPPRPDHYQGLPAPSLETALANLTEYGDRLAAVLAAENLTPEDLQTVHQLTYTLENALQRIAEDVEVIAEHLEAVHIASERADTATVGEQGQAYLEAVRPLTHASVPGQR